MKFVSIISTLCMLGIQFLTAGCNSQPAPNGEADKRNDSTLVDTRSTDNQPFTNTADKTVGLTDDSLRNLALARFTQYKTKLEDEEAIVGNETIHLGDFTGDGLADAAVHYSLELRNGGNAMMGLGVVLYEQVGNDLNFLQLYEPDYQFTLDTIASGKIVVTELDYGPSDGRCCPSIKTNREWTVAGKKINDKKVKGK